MSLATICLAVACTLPILCTGIAKQRGAFDPFRDNADPRGWLAKQSGVAARANAAQANSWEALIVFAPAVLTAQLAQAPTSWVDALAVTFVVSRVIYVGVYLADLAALRSAVWFVGYGASLALFFVSLAG